MKLVPCFALAWLIQATAATSASPIQFNVYPPQPLIERTHLGQGLNFDFELTNTSAEALELREIRAAVRDPQGRIIERLQLSDSGDLPAINTLPTRSWKPGESHTIPNPFHTISGDVAIGRLDFEFDFTKGTSTVTAVQVIHPLPFRQKTRLQAPMPGRVLVWDGHDFYAHHRRWDFSSAALKRLGIVSNPGRYSLDLVIVNSDGAFHSGSGNKPEEYFSYRTPIVAPGGGTVVALANDASDEPSEPTQAAFKQDPMRAIYGNYVTIDHGNGEFSQLGHLKKGSVRVHVGDRVRPGQQIAEAGESGTSIFPHLHYQLVNGPSITVEGLPPRFENIRRVVGGARRPEADSAVDSGDIFETIAGHGRTPDKRL